MKVLIEVECQDNKTTVFSIAAAINKRLHGLEGFVNAEPAGETIDLVCNNAHDVLNKVARVREVLRQVEYATFVILDNAKELRERS